jgi:hypothetical protein
MLRKAKFQKILLTEGEGFSLKMAHWIKKKLEFKLLLEERMGRNPKGMGPEEIAEANRKAFRAFRGTLRGKVDVEHIRSTNILRDLAKDGFCSAVGDLQLHLLDAEQVYSSVKQKMGGWLFGNDAILMGADEIAEMKGRVFEIAREELLLSRDIVHLFMASRGLELALPESLDGADGLLAYEHGFFSQVVEMDIKVYMGFVDAAANSPVLSSLELARILYPDSEAEVVSEIFDRIQC